MENKEVVMRIKMLIESKNVSPSGFAKLIGYNQSNLSKVLRGERVVPTNLINAICEGLKDVGMEIGVEHLQFYAARHSLATIAANDAGVPIYTVNAMLNHTDTKMRITELYIKKDFKAINDANVKVLSYVLNEN